MPRLDCCCFLLPALRSAQTCTTLHSHGTALHIHTELWNEQQWSYCRLIHGVEDLGQRQGSWQEPLVINPLMVSLSAGFSRPRDWCIEPHISWWVYIFKKNVNKLRTANCVLGVLVFSNSNCPRSSLSDWEGLSLRQMTDGFMITLFHLSLWMSQLNLGATENFPENKGVKITY